MILKYFYKQKKLRQTEHINFFNLKLLKYKVTRGNSVKLIIKVDYKINNA